MVVSETSDYRITVSRSPQRPYAAFYLFGLRQAIPAIPIPLRPNEKEPVLPLNDLLHTIYDQGAYDLVIDYSQPPSPPLSAEDAAWARTTIDQAGASRPLPRNDAPLV